MSVKEQRRIQGFVHQSVQEVFKEHDELCRSTTKKSGEEHWNRLTNNITILRRRLSKLEKHAYEVISMRFDKVRMPTVHEPQSVNGNEVVDNWSGDGFDTNETEVNNGCYSDISTSKTVPDSSTIITTGFSLRDVEMSTPPSTEDLEVTTSPCREKKNLEDVMDDILAMVTDEQEYVLATEMAKQEMDKELFNLIRDTRLILPPAIPFTKGSEFPAKIVYIISPLEFYVIKQTHLKVLRQMESVLDACCNKLIRYPLITDNFKPDNACLILDERFLYRALIREAGEQEVQVYLVDYGRPKFVPRDKCYPIPKCIANMAPPLAHCCTLIDIDSRSLDNDAMMKFHEKAANVTDVFVRALGEFRQSHGQLVELIDNR